MFVGVWLNELEEFIPKGKLPSNNSVCSKRFHIGGSILKLIDELVKVGQTMGYNMEGCAHRADECDQNRLPEQMCLSRGDIYNDPSLLRFYQNNDIPPLGNIQQKAEGEEGPEWVVRSKLKKQIKDDDDERLLSIFKQTHINLQFQKGAKEDNPEKIWVVSFYLRQEPIEPLEWKALKNQLKPSTTTPPKLGLKELLEHLKYAFLQEDEQLPIVISFALSSNKKSKLLENANPPPTNNRPVLLAALHAQVIQELHELQKILAFVDSRLENNDSDDGEVLNELIEYENVKMLRREKAINIFDEDDLAF
ncbi:hypothetical protein Tco_0133865 [Tanacetum coccineum]